MSDRYLRIVLTVIALELDSPASSLPLVGGSPRDFGVSIRWICSTEKARWQEMTAGFLGTDRKSTRLNPVTQ